MAVLEDITAQLANFANYIQHVLIPGVIAGDLVSMAFAGVMVILACAVLFIAGVLIYEVLKRTILLLVVGISLYFFVTRYSDQLLQQGPTGQTILFGVVGIGFGVIALLIALSAFGHSAKEARRRRYAHEAAQPWLAPGAPRRMRYARMEAGEEAPGEKPSQLQVAPEAVHGAPATAAAAPAATAAQAAPAASAAAALAQPTAAPGGALTKQALFDSLRNDRSLLAVLSYVIISEFGVFSSPTIHAPNVMTGMALLAVFFIGVFVLIRTAYKNYVRGVSHLLAAAGFGFVLSVILGHFWVGIPLENLLSMQYFATEAAVALITGIAVALLMGGRS